MKPIAAALVGASLFPSASVPVPVPLEPGLYAASAEAVPRGSTLLKRAELNGVSLRELGEAIQESPDVPGASRALQRLGLLRAEEGALRDPDRLFAFEQSLRRVWHEASAAVPPQFEIDRSWPVPSLKVDREGVTYHVHPIVHGDGMAVSPGSVRRLVKVLERGNLPLYSEQELPWMFGYSHGKETLDHRVKTGEPAGLRSIPFEDVGQAGFRTRTAVKTFVAAGLAGGPLLHLFLHPTNLWAWGLAAVGLGAAWTVWDSLRPAHRLWQRGLAVAALVVAGSPDLAHRLNRRASALFGRRLDPAELRRIELPMPMRSEGRSLSTRRSESMAEIIGLDAEQRRYDEVHVLAGFDHAHELAWHLSGKP